MNEFAPRGDGIALVAPYLDPDSPIEEEVKFISLRVPTGPLVWEEWVVGLLVVYICVAGLKVHEVLQGNHHSMAVGPAIFGLTGLLGAIALVGPARKKRRIRRAHLAGRYRQGIFLSPDQLVINIPRLTRVFPWDQVVGVREEATFAGRPPDSVCIDVLINGVVTTIRLRERLVLDRETLVELLTARVTELSDEHESTSVTAP
jgi:hypothetical protein